MSPARSASTAEPIAARAGRLALPGGAQGGHHADLGQQRGQADHQVLLAVDHGPFAEHVLVGVDVGVDQPAALGRSARRAWRRPLSSLEDLEEASVCDDAHRQAEADGRARRTVLPGIVPARGSRVARAEPNSMVARAAAHPADRVQRRAARRNQLVLGPGRAHPACRSSRAAASAPGRSRATSP